MTVGKKIIKDFTRRRKKEHTPSGFHFSKNKTNKAMPSVFSHFIKYEFQILSMAFMDFKNLSPIFLYTLYITSHTQNLTNTTSSITLETAKFRCF